MSSVFAYSSKTITVGSSPAGIAINTKTKEAYVADSSGDSNSITVINASNNMVIKTIKAGLEPLGIAVNGNTNMIYVADFGESKVSVVNGTYHRLVANVTVGFQPGKIRINPITNMIYTIQQGAADHSISVINGTTNLFVKKIELGSFETTGIDVDAQKNLVYVTYRINPGGNQTAIGEVSVIDGKTNTIVKTIQVGSAPQDIAINPNTNMIYVTDDASENDVLSINGITYQIVNTIPLPVYPTGLGVNTRTNTIFAANEDNNTVSMMNGTDDSFVSTIGGFNCPTFIGMNSNKSEIYVNNYCGNTVRKIDVTCKAGLQLITKAEDKSPACVRQVTSDELVKRGWAQSGMVPSKRDPHIVKPLNPINLSPCETRYEGKLTTTSPVYPNGTVITTGYVPVLYMPQNSTGMICVNYTNVNQQATAQIRIFEANNLSHQANIQYYASPDTIAKGNSTVVYTISTGNQAGFYGISFFCGGIPFAVGYDNQSRIITDDFPWIGQIFHCPLMTYNYKISGLHGIGTYYIKTVSHEQLSYDLQNTTITSYSMGTNSHKATFSLHIRTFDKPARFWFDYKDSTARKFVINPGFKFGSDACNWDVTDNSQMQNTPWLRIDGIHVKENSVSIPANSNGTYTFSILAENLSDGYYGLNPVVYGATTDVSPEDAGTNYIAYNFPIITGIGNTKILDFSGTCLR